MKKIFKVSLLLGVILVIAVSVLGYMAFKPIDLTDRIPQVKAIIEDHINGRVEMKSLRLKLLPMPYIEIQGLDIIGLEGPVLSSETVKMKLHLIPLFHKKAVIKNLTVEHADIRIDRDNNGITNIKKLLRKKLLDIKIVNAEIKESGLRLRDNFLSEPHDGVHFPHDGVSLPIAYAVEDLELKISPSANGYLYSASGKSSETTLSIKGTAIPRDNRLDLGGMVKAKGFELSTINPYMKMRQKGIELKGLTDLELEYSLKETIELKGNVDFNDLKIKPSESMNTINLTQGSAGLVFRQNKDDIEFSLMEFLASLDGTEVSGDMHMAGPSSNPRINIGLSTGDMPYDSLKKLIPIEFLNKTVAKRFEAFKTTNGTVAVRDFTLSGRLDELKNASGLLSPGAFSLIAAVKDMDFTYLNFKRPFSGVKGDVALKDSTLQVRNMSGLYGNVPIKGFELDISGLGKKIDYSFGFDSTFMAEEALKDFGHFKTLSKIKDAKGPVEMRLNMESKAGKKTFSGRLVLKNTRLAHSSMPLTFDSLSGEFSFDPQRLSFSSMQALTNGSAFTMNGTIEDYNEKTPLASLDIQGALSHETVISFLKDNEDNLPDFDKVRFTAFVKGKKDSLSIKTSIDLADTTLGMGDILKKEKGFPMSLKGGFTLKENKLIINDATLNFGASSLSLKGRYTGTAYSLDISSDNGVKIEDLDNISPYFLIKDSAKNGEVSFRLKAEKKAEAEKAAYTGEIKLANGSFSSPLIRKPVQEINLLAVLNGTSALIKLERLTAGETSLKGELKILDMKTGMVEFGIHAPYLNTEDIIPERLPKPSKPNDPFFTGKGTFSANSGILWGQPFDFLTMEVTLDKNRASFSPIVLSTHGGAVTGRLDYMRDANNPILYETELRLSRIGLEPLIKAVGTKEKILTGEINGDIKLSAVRGTDPLTSRTDGNINLSSKDGKLWRFIVISKIFSIVNIISITDLFEHGLPYNSLKGDFTIEKGVASTHDLFLESSSMRMSAVGSIDLNKKEINATLGVHPFVTVDKIITSIPLAGWIIGGKEK
ncbi:MAG: AsmA-like C-terminal domain-containing protein, partial [Deltaproteobacteria bacterium]|nr:AsmA-like C-terminal domain-containing protein [Deltaproteobacteria bacterium]